MHTPTPWEIHLDENKNFAIEHKVGASMGEVIATVYEKKDAAFIVQAVNAHEDFVSSLKWLLVYEGMDPNDDRRIKAVQNAKETLAKAGVNL